MIYQVGQVGEGRDRGCMSKEIKYLGDFRGDDPQFSMDE